MNYFFEILIFTPFLYALPLFVSRSLFGLRPERANAIAYLATSGGCVLITFWLFQGMNQIPLRIILSFAAMLIMFLIYIKTDALTIAFTFMISGSVAIICELGVFLISSLIFTEELLLFNYNNGTTLQFNLITFIFSYIIVYAVYFIKKNKFHFRISENRESLLMALVIILILGIAVFIILDAELFSVINIGNSSIRRIFVEVSIFVLLTFFICIMSIRQTFREKKKNEALAQAKTTLVELYDSTRTFRHNYRNSLITINGYLNDGNIDGLREIITGLNQEFEIINQLDDIPDMIKIKESGLRWLLLSKYTLAINESISFSVLVTPNISEALLKKNDLHTVLGVLLDNAIESARLSEEKAITFSMVTRQDDVLISVRNSFLNKPDISKIYDKGYTTKKGHEGLGLFSVRRILSKYDNVFFDVMVKNHIFEIDINIQNGDLTII